MQKIAEILDDWFLTDEEVRMIKNYKKCLITLPKSYELKTNSIIFASGIAMKIESEETLSIFEICTRKDIYDILDDYGIKRYTIHASGDNPEMNAYAYVRYEKDNNVSHKSRIEAFKDHLMNYEGFGISEYITFYRIRYLNQ